jgi:hypothetical protein
VVYESVLRARSDYFDIKLSKQQQEPKTITLAAHNPIIFSLYVHLIYTGRIASKFAVTKPDFDTEYEYLCELYVLAYKFRDIAAQKLVIDAPHEKSKKCSLTPLAKWSAMLLLPPPTKSILCTCVLLDHVVFVVSW